MLFCIYLFLDMRNFAVSHRELGRVWTHLVLVQSLIISFEDCVWE